MDPQPHVEIDPKRRKSETSFTQHSCLCGHGDCAHVSEALRSFNESRSSWMIFSKSSITNYPPKMAHNLLVVDACLGSMGSFGALASQLRKSFIRRRTQLTDLFGLWSSTH